MKSRNLSSLRVKTFSHAARQNSVDIDLFEKRMAQLRKYSELLYRRVSAMDIPIEKKMGHLSAMLLSEELDQEIAGFARQKGLYVDASNDSQ